MAWTKSVQGVCYLKGLKPGMRVELHVTHGAQIRIFENSNDPTESEDFDSIDEARAWGEEIAEELELKA